MSLSNDEILKLAETCGFGVEPDERLSDGKLLNYWECDEEQLLEFAQAMYNKGQEEIRRQKTGIGYVNGVLFVDEF